MIARISGYGQTGPYAARAGFASVAEAMGGIRYINGFPERPPPRMDISLGDSLAAMFAARASWPRLPPRRPGRWPPCAPCQGGGGGRASAARMPWTANMAAERVAERDAGPRQGGSPGKPLM